MGKLLQQLQHGEELIFGDNFITLLSNLEGIGDNENLPSLLLNNKSLILDTPDLDCDSAGIALALRIFHVLDSLVIEKLILEVSNNLWRTALDFFMSHLKTVHITGLSKRKVKCKVLLDFVRFIQKNAPALENFVMLK